jgi:hypothetical protein
MKDLRKQHQRKTGYPYGECVRASYASFFQIPIDEVPRFDPALITAENLGRMHLGRKLEGQTGAERKWLKSRGFDLVIVPGNAGPLVPADLRHLMSISTTRSQYAHRVVGRGGRIDWDPHPGGSTMTKVRAFYFIVPKL